MEKKETIRKIMRNYLEAYGYPDRLSNEDIMNHHLVPMFEILVQQRLVPPGAFRHYYAAALEAYYDARMYQ